MDRVSVRNSREVPGDRRWMEGVYREYLNDLAPASSSGVFPALREVGHSEADQLGRWFGDRNAEILTVCFGQSPVGFAMVHHRRDASPEYAMAEFFIAGPWRRRGIGAQAVRLILDRFAGQWLITEHVSNPAAVKFWRHVVQGYTDGRYRERIFNSELEQRFESGGAVNQRR